ncbi:hypothetical protein PCL_00366 [Purpureocillium lilacinum]|uniref:Uncharacterized protein n=1 Tax=Purpureocillium lilacinum TaxID=33203 RepID=A0A2U3E6U2_PURLI|nr:hypothetical protein PCL_00366 [Purpureocillium lilacinum]
MPSLHRPRRSAGANATTLAQPTPPREALQAVWPPVAAVEPSTARARQPNVISRAVLAGWRDEEAHRSSLRTGVESTMRLDIFEAVMHLPSIHPRAWRADLSSEFGALGLLLT